jgi:hypothetical protein
VEGRLLKVGRNANDSSRQEPRQVEDPDLTNSGVGGVQIADVSVDIETGIVRVNKMVAVQDCGLIIDLKTAESQVLGALIMGISSRQRLPRQLPLQDVYGTVVQYRRRRSSDLQRRRHGHLLRLSQRSRRRLRTIAPCASESLTAGILKLGAGLFLLWPACHSHRCRTSLTHHPSQV